MCAAWKKKNERNEIVYFYRTKSDILLCGIARFSLGNKNKLRTFQSQKWKKNYEQPASNKIYWFLQKKSVLSFIISLFLLFRLRPHIFRHWDAPYRTSDSVTPSISRVLISRHLIFCSLTSPTCCNSPREAKSWASNCHIDNLAESDREVGK